MCIPIPLSTLDYLFLGTGMIYWLGHKISWERVQFSWDICDTYCNDLHYSGYVYFSNGHVMNKRQNTHPWYPVPGSSPIRTK